MLGYMCESALNLLDRHEYAWREHEQALGVVNVGALLPGNGGGLVERFISTCMHHMYFFYKFSKKKKQKVTRKL